MNPMLESLLAHETPPRLRAAHAPSIDLLDEPTAVARVTGSSMNLTALLARRKGSVEVVAEFSPKVRLDLPVESLDEAITTALRSWHAGRGLRHWVALRALIAREDGAAQASSGRGPHRPSDLVMWKVDDHLEAAGYAARSRRDPKVREAAIREVEALTTLELSVFDGEGNLVFRGAPVKALFKALGDSAGRWMVEQMVLQPHAALRAVGMRRAG